MRGILFALAIFLLFSVGLNAQALREVRSIPLDAWMVAMDELGNTYVVRYDNVLIRYNSKGDSTGFYRSALNGDIGVIDATNPLKILLYYPAFSKITLLDRMLTMKAEIDLRRNNIVSSTAVALASDGNLWVYDPFNAKLIKLNETGDIVRSSNDLRQEIDFVPNPVFMLERDRRVYVSDTVNGILVFDQFGTFINTLPLTGIPHFQAYGGQLVYLRGSILHSYDIQRFNEQEYSLPKSDSPILDAAIGQETLSILYKNRLVLYEWPPQK